MSERMLMSGVREFTCGNCEAAWKDKTRDVLSQSCMECPVCGEITYPVSYVVVHSGELH